MADKIGERLQKTGDVFGLEAELTAGFPRVTVSGCRRVFIENHRGLLEYGTDTVLVSGRRAKIRIKGSGLELKEMTDCEMTVTGLVESVGFELGGAV